MDIYIRQGTLVYIQDIYTYLHIQTQRQSKREREREERATGMTGDLAFEKFEKKTPRIGLLYIYTYSVMRQNILTFIERTKKKT